uniref:Uncharacterized protein n=1 Tax=Oryza barthii TaxID=65489 RepID=A0A0D3HVK2_9ORYZ
MPRSGRPPPISLPLDPLPLPDLAGGEWSVKTKEGGGGDDAVEEEDEGKARWRKGRRALDLSGGSGVMCEQRSSVAGGKWRIRRWLVHVLYWQRIFSLAVLLRMRL